MRKKWLVYILTLIMAVTLAACGGDSQQPSQTGDKTEAENKKAVAYEPGERTIKLWRETLNPKEHPVHLVYRMNMEGEMVTITLGMKGNDSYTDFTYQGQQMTSLTKDNTLYSIVHAEKMVMKMDATPFQDMIDAAKMEAEVQSENISWQAGSEEIDGTTYEYDEMIDTDGSTFRTYFTAGSDQFKYLDLGNGEKAQVVAYDQKVPDEWFVLPADYQIMDVNQMMGGMDLPPDVNMGS